jgi:uncharacterized protein
MELMKLEHYSVKKLKKNILNIFGKYLSLEHYEIFFFGSRVNGKANKRSDIDIGIKGKKPIPIEIIEKIREDISELPILYKIDVVDFNKINKNFYKIAMKTIISIKNYE